METKCFKDLDLNRGNSCTATIFRLKDRKMGGTNKLK